MQALRRLAPAAWRGHRRSSPQEARGALLRASRRTQPRFAVLVAVLCGALCRGAAAAMSPPAPGPPCFACRPSGWGSGQDDPLNVDSLPCCSSRLANPPPAPPEPPAPARAPPPQLSALPRRAEGGVSAGVLGGALGAGVGGAALLGLAGGVIAWRAHRRRRGPSVPFLLPPTAVPLAQLRRIASRVSQSRVGPAPLPRSSYSRLGNPDAPLGPDGAGGDGAGLLADDVDDLEAGGTGEDDGAPRVRRQSLLQTVSTGLRRSTSLLSRAALGTGGPTRTASLLSESALLTASSDGDEDDRSSVSGSGGAPGRDTRRMSLWSLAGDAPEMPPEADEEDDKEPPEQRGHRRRGDEDEP